MGFAGAFQQAHAVRLVGPRLDLSCNRIVDLQEMGILRRRRIDDPFDKTDIADKSSIWRGIYVSAVAERFGDLRA